MKKPQLIDVILIAEAIVLVVEVIAIMAMPSRGCYESLDQYPNLPDHGNFGQPILTEHNCHEGQIPSNWRDFEPKGN